MKKVQVSFVEYNIFYCFAYFMFLSSELYAYSHTPLQVGAYIY